MQNQGYGFSSEESWALKNWCFWTVVLEKTLESPLDCKEIQPVHPKGDQSWVFIGRLMLKLETPILWPPHAKSWLIGKYPVAGRDWGQEEKGTTEDEMAGWHHQLNGHEFEWTLGAGDGQGGLACCNSWERKKLDTTENLNWTELMQDQCLAMKCHHFDYFTGCTELLYWFYFIGSCKYFKIFIYYYFYCYIFNPEMLTIEWEKNLIRFSMFKNMRINYFINILKILEIHKWLWTLETKGKRWTMEDEMVVASPTQCTWVWESFQRWWWTGKPGMLQSMRSQWIGHDWLAEQQQQKWTWTFSFIVIL